MIFFRKKKDREKQTLIKCSPVFDKVVENVKIYADTYGGVVDVNTDECSVYIMTSTGSYVFRPVDEDVSEGLICLFRKTSSGWERVGCVKEAQLLVGTTEGFAVLLKKVFGRYTAEKMFDIMEKTYEWVMAEREKILRSNF